MGDKTRGLFGKFNISRRDGTDAPGGKHDGCEYFVLDVTHDPFAISALADYARQCDRDGYRELASDLGAMIRRSTTRGSGQITDAALSCRPKPKS